MDAEVGEILRQLEEDGLSDSTIVFYYGDHGSGMPRSKRWPFDSGLRVPLLLHIPDRFQHLAPEDYTPGGESTRLTAFVDLGPTAISLAGIEPPANMQGVPFAGKYEGPSKRYLFGFRGRMDERIDMVRSCTDGRYVYMRHFYPDRPYLKHVDYMFQTPTTRVWKQLFDEGKLDTAQAKFWQTKPVEELFDLETDPSEVVNLADRPEQAMRVAKMRSVLKQWMIDTADLGLLTEAEMHARCRDVSPRQYATSGELPVKRLTEIAFDAVDPASARTVSDLAALAGDADSAVRFWGVRGLAIRSGDGDPSAIDPLRQAADDPSASVAIAACDGLLRSADASDHRLAIDRLLGLADVNKHGHFAAVAALNVLDMNATLDEVAKTRLGDLPRQVRKPPPRVGKYVGRLLDHMTTSTR
jgi:uncharacterized sulfatase